MKWLVCGNKKTRELYVSTRKERERLLESCARYNAKPLSLVEKKFITEGEAKDYIQSILKSEELLKNIFK